MLLDKTFSFLASLCLLNKVLSQFFLLFLKCKRNKLTFLNLCENLDRLKQFSLLYQEMFEVEWHTKAIKGTKEVCMDKKNHQAQTSQWFLINEIRHHRHFVFHHQHRGRRWYYGSINLWSKLLLLMFTVLLKISYTHQCSHWLVIKPFDHFTWWI